MANFPRTVIWQHESIVSFLPLMVLPLCLKWLLHYDDHLKAWKWLPLMPMLINIFTSLWEKCSVDSLVHCPELSLGTKDSLPQLGMLPTDSLLPQAYLFHVMAACFQGLMTEGYKVPCLLTLKQDSPFSIFTHKLPFGFLLLPILFPFFSLFFLPHMLIPKELL